jgi:hypothetical protein
MCGADDMPHERLPLAHEMCVLVCVCAFGYVKGGDKKREGKR